MAKPFVSHDGTDPNGIRAEVYVQTGTGTVKELKENGNNINVFMAVDGLKHPIGGWTSKSEAIYPMLVEAYESGREITYRIESQRKNGIDRATPIAVLRETMDTAKENCRNLFVGVDGTLSSEAVTDPAEDPYAGGRIPATDPRNKPAAAPTAGGPGGFTAEQALTGLAAARQGGLSDSIIDSAAALALAAGASVQQVLTAGVDEQAEPAERQVQRVVAAEAAPFNAYNTDGRVNLGSYAVQAGVGAESLAAELIHDNAVAVAEAHNAAVEAGEVEGEKIEPQPVNFKSAAALGSVLLDLADRVQVGTYEGGRPSRMANSHTRARSFVYDAVKNRYPVPFGADADTQEEWKKQVVAEGIERFKWAVKIALKVNDMPAAPAEQTQQAPAQQAPTAPVEQTATEAPAPAVETAPVVSTATGEPVVHQQEVPEAPAAPVEQPEAQVRQIGTSTQEKPKVLVEGDEGFVAPEPEVLQRFGALSRAAGFEPTPDSPVLAYLFTKFDVPAARKINGADLDKLVTWYEQQGEAGPSKFRQHVLAVAGDAVSA